MFLGKNLVQNPKPIQCGDSLLSHEKPSDLTKRKGVSNMHSFSPLNIFQKVVLEVSRTYLLYSFVVLYLRDNFYIFALFTQNFSDVAHSLGISYERCKNYVNLEIYTQNSQ